jgi:hypothetical protein
MSNGFASFSRLVLLAVSTFGTCLQGAQADARPVQKGALSQEEFRQLRCQREGDTVYFAGTGEIHTLGQPGLPGFLFRVTGVDIARCEKHPVNGLLYVLSRELTLYQDPRSGEVLQAWENPLTKETLPVVHNANRYQGFPLPPQVPAEFFEKWKVVTFNVDSRIPNSQFGNPAFAPYMREREFLSHESYSFQFQGNEGLLRFTRVGPWLPWMKMGSAPGQLVYSITSYRTENFEQLPLILQQEINQRLPLFKQAPRCFLEGEPPNSWELFPKIFDAYLQGQRFPLPAPLESDPCLKP